MIDSYINPQIIETQNCQDFQAKIIDLIKQRNALKIIEQLHAYLQKNAGYSVNYFYGLGNIQDQKGYYLHRELQWYEEQLQLKTMVLNYWDLLCLCCSTVYQNYQYIVTWYKKMIAKYPQKEQLQLGIGNIHYNNNKFEECQPYFLKVIDINPKSQKGYQLISFLNYFKYEHDDIALQYITKCLQINPQNIYAHYLIAVTQEEPEKEVQFLQRLIDKYPFYTRSYIGFYFHYMYRYKGAKQEGLRMAQYYCHKAIEINPLYDNTYESLANIYKRKKDYDKAKDYCLKALSLRPNQDNPYNIMGNIELDLQSYELALIYYKKSIEINPINFHAMFNLGLTYQNLKEYQNAIAAYQKCLKYKPNNYDASYNLALLSCQLKNQQNQIKYYELCISINPKEPNAFYNLGVRYIEDEKYQKAISYFQNSIKANNRMHKAFYNIGDCLIHLHRHSQAIQFINKALEIDPNNTLYSTSLAKTLIHLRKYENIMEIVQNTKKNYQSFKDLSTRNRQYVHSELDNFYGLKSQWIEKNRVGVFPLIQMIRLRKLQQEFEKQYQQFFA